MCEATHGCKCYLYPVFYYLFSVTFCLLNYNINAFMQVKEVKHDNSAI